MKYNYPILVRYALLSVSCLSLQLFAGCMQEDERLLPREDSEKSLLGVSSLYADAGETSVTRAGVTSPLPATETVGFFVKANGSYYDAQDNKPGKYSSTAGMWLPNDSIWLNNVEAEIAVYHPYSASQSTSGLLNLAASLRTDDKKDLCSGRFRAHHRSKNVSVTLTHLYSRLLVTFVKDAAADYTGMSALTRVALDGTGIYATATFQPVDSLYASYATSGYATDLSGVTIAGTNPAAVDATRVDFLLPPSTLGSDVTLTATVDTKEMKVTVPRTAFEGNALLPGKQYNLKLTLKPTALVLSSLKITGWDAVAAFDQDATLE